MKPSSVLGDDWIDDSPREGPLTEHLRGSLTKLDYVMREVDQAMRNLSSETLHLRAEISKQCIGYPRRLHQQAAVSCQAVEGARAELARAHAQIFALIAEMENYGG